MKKTLIITLSLFLATTTAALAQDSTSRAGQIKKTQSAAQEKRVQAQQSLAQKRAELEQKKADLKASAEAKKDAACQRRLDKLENRIANSDKRKKGLMTHYQKATEHLQRLIDRGTAAGVDVTELSADLVEYNTLVDGLATDFDAYIEVMAQAQSLDCEQPKEQFQSLHQQIKTAHQKIISDRRAIHDYYKTTVRPDVVTAIKAMAATKESKEESTDTTTGGGE